MGVPDYIQEVTKLYKKILLREPDKTGLYYLINLLKKGQMTLEDVRKSLSESKEGKAISQYSHYTDKYWNDLKRVARYKNKLATGKENTNWIEDIPSSFKNYVPFKKVLIVGCGNGWVERKLSDMKIGLQFDAFDISDNYLEEAKKNRGDRHIHYFVEDINKMNSIDDEQYDAVFNFAILHHVTKLEYALEKLSKCLKKDGLMFNEEYVGPARNQYSDEHLQIMLEVMSDLPEKFRTTHSLRPPLANFRVEPSEAIHSDLIRPTFEKYFDIVYERDMNGGIAYMILWNNIEKFENSNDSEASRWLEYLLEKDIELSNNGKVPILFWYGVGKPKSHVN